MSTTLHAPDLTQRAPRSGRVRLGGYVILPRMLDKGRADLVGKIGAYHYACPLDQNFLTFAGVDADKLKEQLALGLGDGAILEWINANSTKKREAWEIAAWSAHQETRGPGDSETKEWFAGEVAKLSKTREDMATWFEWLDVDDHVSYGGQA